MYQTPSREDTLARSSVPWDFMARGAGNPKKLRMTGIPWLGEGVTRDIVGRDTGTKGTPSQPRIVFSTRIVDINDGSTKDMQRFSTVWIAKTTPRTATKHANVGYTIMPTHELNYRLALRTFKGRFDEIPTLADVRCMFTFAGVLSTAVTEPGYANGDRMITIDRQNPFGSVSNIWGSRLVGGMTVWLICKLVRVDRSIGFCNVASRPVQHMQSTRDDGRTLPYPEHVIQFVPHATIDSFVAAEDLCTTIVHASGLKEVVQGWAVRVGRVIFSEPLPNMDLHEGARSAAVLQTCPLAEISICA